MKMIKIATVVVMPTRSEAALAGGVTGALSNTIFTAMNNIGKPKEYKQKLHHAAIKGGIAGAGAGVGYNELKRRNIL